jgi:Holliday junction resolvase
MAYLSFYRLRESQEETGHESKLGAVENYLRFERDVVREMKRTGVGFRASSSSGRGGYDFAASKGDKTYLIEVKAWSRPMPLGVLRQVIERLASAVLSEKADGGILVTQRSLGRLPSHSDLPVEVLTLREFRNYFAHS